MRIQTIAAIAEGFIKQATKFADKLAYIAAGEKLGYPYSNLLCWNYDRDIRYYRILNLAPIAETLSTASAAQSGNWDIFMLTPIEPNNEHGLDLLRFLRRISANKPKVVCKALSLMSLLGEYPNIARKLCVQADGKLRPPETYLGEPDPELIAKIDYNPSEEDCISDNKPDMASILAMMES